LIHQCHIERQRIELSIEILQKWGCLPGHLGDQSCRTLSEQRCSRYRRLLMAEWRIEIEGVVLGGLLGYPWELQGVELAEAVLKEQLLVLLGCLLVWHWVMEE
jgi:hypothetical protein